MEGMGDSLCREDSGKHFGNNESEVVAESGGRVMTRERDRGK